MDPHPLSRSIVSHRAEPGGTSIFLDFEIQKDGTLALEGQDIGKAPEEVFGDSDYEYWIHIEPQYKELVLLELLAEKFQGDLRANTHFREWLTAKGIPYQGGSY